MSNKHPSHIKGRPDKEHFIWFTRTSMNKIVFFLATSFTALIAGNAISFLYMEKGDSIVLCSVLSLLVLAGYALYDYICLLDLQKKHLEKHQKFIERAEQDFDILKFSLNSIEEERQRLYERKLNNESTNTDTDITERKGGKESNGEERRGYGES